MFADDYIMRQIEGLSRMLARVLFDRDMESEELHLDEDGTLSGSDVLAYRLKKLLHERKINEAENLLFETLEASPLPSYGRTALDLLRTQGKTILLEIDPPIDALSIRRQGFYRRAG